MNRDCVISKENTRYMIEVMQAYLDGKKIEYIRDGEYENYQDVDIPCWNWENGLYRIKKEVK